MKSTVTSIKLIYEFAKQSRWNEALSLANELDHDEKDIMTALLVIAFSVKTDLNVIDFLIRSGAEWNDNMLMILIQHDKVDVIEKMLTYGVVDINYVDQRYYTPLMFSVQQNSSKTFNLLLSKGAMVNSPFLGFDALDIALNNYGADRYKFHYIKGLINAGAKIDLSHKQRVQEIKTENLDSFIFLTKIFPELI